MPAKMQEPSNSKRKTLPDLTREQFLAADDRKPQRAEVPALGGAVYIRVMCGTERAKWESEAAAKGRGGSDEYVEVLASLLARVVSDAAGNRLFSDEDIPDLMEKASTTLLSLALKAKRVNALSDEDIDALAKN